MAANDNSVNIEKKSYHHGDLRAALIAEGMRLLDAGDADSLSLREVARKAGVSATSVYRHFPDKDALLSAIAQEGLAKLARVQRDAAEGAGGGIPGFAATGRAYVRFALANPALFRLIFASPARRAGDTAGEPEAMTLLRENASRLAQADIDDAATAVQAARSWSLVHGLAMLMLDGQLPADDALIDRVIIPAE